MRSTTIVDIDASCRPIAEKADHRFIASRVEDLSLDEQFGAILAVNVIEHVAAPRDVLAKFAELLAPGGRVLVKTPNTQSLDERLFRHRSWGGFHCPRHWVLFDRQSLEEAAVASGLEVEHFAFVQGAPFWTVNVLDLLEQKGLIHRSPGQSFFDHWAFGPVAALFAAFDMARGPFAPTSQMVVVLRRAGADG